MDASIAEQLRMRRRLVRGWSGRAPRKLRRLPKQNQPRLIEVAYYSAIVRLLERARQMVELRLRPRLLSLVEEARRLRGDSAREDAGGREVDRLMDDLSEAFYDGLMPVRLEELVGTFGEQVSKHQRRELLRQLAAATGVEVPFADVGIRARIADFTAENVQLIKSIPQRYFDQVGQRVISGLREGVRWEEIAEQMQDRFGVAESSAKLVARDQVGKFYGELQQTRQESLGIETYVWRTVSDNRVRPEHEERDGEIFRWDDPPEDGHPGKAINCRCYAEPDLSGILASL